MRQPLVIAVASAALWSGCIVEAPGSQSNPSSQQRAATSAPPLSLRGGPNFDGKLEVLGATISPGTVTPGVQTRVSLFMKVLKPIDKDYLVFVHLEGGDGRMERMNVDHPPAGGTYPTSRWKVGETITDEFGVYLPPGVPASSLNIWYGFWQPETDRRMHVTNAESVRTDGSDRVLLAQVPVSG